MKTLTKTQAATLIKDWDRETQHKHGNEVLENLFGDDKRTIDRIVEQFPCLSRFRSLLKSIEKNAGGFCWAETLRHGKTKKAYTGEVQKISKHKNLRCGVGYTNQKQVNELHESGEVEKQGFINGRANINGWLYVRLDALESESFSELDFTLGLTPNTGELFPNNPYGSKSTYLYNGKEISKELAKEMCGSYLFSKPSGKPFLRFTPFVAKLLDFGPMS